MMMVFDENANMLGRLDIDLEDSKLRSVVIPFRAGANFGQIVMKVETILNENNVRFRVLRANKRDFDRLKRCPAFLPAIP